MSNDQGADGTAVRVSIPSNQSASYKSISGSAVGEMDVPRPSTAGLVLNHITTLKIKPDSQYIHDSVANIITVVRRYT